MRTFIELNIFIDCPRDKVYDHLSEPINMIGLHPLLTTIDVLKERQDERGVLLRPYYTVETHRLAGILFFSESHLLGHPSDEAEGGTRIPRPQETGHQHRFQLPAPRIGRSEDPNHTDCQRCAPSKTS